jgi:hypothetical protein
LLVLALVGGQSTHSLGKVRCNAVSHVRDCIKQIYTSVIF